MCRCLILLSTYNGEKYLPELLESVLAQKDIYVDILARDDGSTDKTVEILKKYDRVKVYGGNNLKPAKSFLDLIWKADINYDYYALCDQDDVWKKNKMIKIQQAFEDPKVMAVVHDAQIVDEKLSSLNETTFEWRDSKAGFWKNMKKNSYIGCCMAVRRSALKRILPIPDNIWIHDQWIGLLAEQLGKVVFIEEPLIYYRRHGGNVTELTHGSITSMIKKRYHMIMEINRRVKEWSEHDKQNQRHIEKP